MGPQVIPMQDVFDNIDTVSYTLPKSKGLTNMISLEDNDAVIEMVVKSRAPQMRHVVRTRRVNLDSMFAKIREDPGIQIK